MSETDSIERFLAAAPVQQGDERRRADHIRGLSSCSELQCGLSFSDGAYGFIRLSKVFRGTVSSLSGFGD